MYYYQMRGKLDTHTHSTWLIIKAKFLVLRLQDHKIALSQGTHTLKLLKLVIQDINIPSQTQLTSFLPSQAQRPCL